MASRVAVDPLPWRARVFVLAVVALFTVAAALLPFGAPDPALFSTLFIASAAASALKLRMPLGVGASTLSASYAFDFAAILMVGGGPAAIMSAVSAFAQSITGTRPHRTTRVAFNVAAVGLTAHAAALTFTYLGGRPGAFDLFPGAKAAAAAALVYYACNSVLICAVIALSTGQPVWRTWHANFLWTAPSYFVGAAAAAGGVAAWQAQQAWLIPFAGLPAGLTFRSYAIYVERLATEKRHHDEVRRLLNAAQESEERYALAAAGSNDGLWDWDPTQDRLYCSERCRRMLGVAGDAPLTRLQDWLARVDDRDRANVRFAFEQHTRAEVGHLEQQFRVHHGEGETRWILCRGKAVRDSDGRALRIAGSQTDVTEWHRVQEHLARAARHDTLTGLPNRALFTELLQVQVAQRPRGGECSYAVFFIDLDGFKLVNDSLGHLAGDEFLRAIAQRLASRLRPGDVLARLGGDEFAVLVLGPGTLDAVCEIAERLQQALDAPFDIDGRDIYASASLGVAVDTEEYRTVADVLRDADAAMYASKAAGRGGYRLFDPTMHSSAVQRLTLETELRRAIERGALLVYYQPIVELPHRGVCGFEALVRWRREDGTVVPPFEFIGVAEETGLIGPLTSFVLRETCRQIAAWRTQYTRPLFASVNISPKLFGSREFIETVEEALETYRLPAGSLRLEITESVLLTDSGVIQRHMNQLHARDVPIYLDDFGTGYSSLAYLQRYPIHSLKLDRSFVMQLGSGHNCAIPEVMVILAQKLGTGLVAEGVETEEHASELVRLGYPHAQGWLFSRPEPAPAIDSLLAAGDLAFGDTSGGVAPREAVHVLK